MKIDCPHCGVHGSVDDSYAGRKLRCPKCTKVFLLTEDILPPVDDSSMMRQEILYDDEPLAAETAALGIMGSEADEAIAPHDDKPESEAEESEEISAISPEITEEDELPGDAFADEDDLLLDSLDEIDNEEPAELETCSGCGESLAPEFLETVGDNRLCALCIPDTDEGDNQDGEDVVAEESDFFEDEEEIEAEVDAEEDNQDGEAAVTEESDFLEDEGEIEAEVETEEDEDDLDLDSTDESDQDEDDTLQAVCSVCGDKFHPDFLQEIDSKLYCGICQPEDVETEIEPDVDVLAAGAGAAVAATAAAVATTDTEDDTEDVTTEQADEEEQDEDSTDFTVGELIKEAWQKTKGTKASIWGGVLFMYLVIFAISFAGIFALQGTGGQMDPNSAIGLNVGLQVVTSWLSTMFMAGLMLLGVRHVKGQRISWKMVFAGFSKALSVTIALVLQIILISIGFILLILPGIYLSVGYALSLPLILEKGLGPWEALEVSRKAIHKKWWTVAGLYFVMALLYMVSMIPLGLGLIWTVPMFFVLVGVLYVRFFGDDVSEEESSVEEETEEDDELEEELTEDEESETEEVESEAELEEELELSDEEGKE